MRAQHLQQTRPQWYDRSPLIIATTTASGIAAPHAPTIRSTYTVPANRKTLLEFAGTQLERVTAAGAIGAYASQVIYTPAAGMPTNVCYRYTYNNVPLSVEFLISTLQAVMLAGDKIELQDFDLSTGGTTSATQWFKATEYDN